MSKDAEQAYLIGTGEAGRDHSLRKPFSDEFCGTSLASIGFIITLLPPPPARLLDLGCGGGWTSVFFAKYGYDVVGQDISQDMINLAWENKRIHGVGDNLCFVRSDYEASVHSDKFDCAVFYDSLHHSDDEYAALLAAGSIEAMRLYGVNERDMPPNLILAQGKKIGFTGFRIYPMPDELTRIIHRGLADVA